MKKILEIYIADMILSMLSCPTFCFKQVKDLKI